MSTCVLEEVVNTWNFVRFNTSHFESNNYLWILGYNVVDELNDIIKYHETDNATLFSIKVIIDRINPNRIDLFGNVSQLLRDQHYL